VSKEELLARQLQDFITTQTGEPCQVGELTRVPGGASRETWSFVATGPRSTRKLVLRRDPPGGTRAHSFMDRSTEFELIRAARATGVPVPEPLWLAAEPSTLGAPAFVTEHVAGETIARRILRDAEYAKARSHLAADCGEILARVHSIDADSAGRLESAGTDPALGALERYRGLLDSLDAPHPAFELGMRWLARNPPPATRQTVVHGDFRNGNIIVGAEGIKAVLDWELAHMGDPWEDLGWLCVRSWRFGGDGEVGGFGRREDLYAAYERASGIPIDVGAVKWWEVFGNLKWGVICVAQAFTHLSGAVRSVELAAIGRRAVETEYDLLRLLKAG
jgi:aminoglycoside phosphotransferase (APT) family kinase protein